MTTPKEQFIQSLMKSLHDTTFIKMSLGNYVGVESDLKKILIKKILIKKKEKLSLVYRYQTNDITKNYEVSEGVKLLETNIEQSKFKQANLFTTEQDYQLRCSAKGKWHFLSNKASSNQVLPQQHDKEKNRKIEARGKQYLHDLKITDAQGKVRPHGQDKFKQINHYIDILSTRLTQLNTSDKLKIADMGSGKGYLTFALYDYLINVMGLKASVTGVEYRKDLVDLCNKISIQAAFKHLKFVQGGIADYQTQKIDVLIALHACDTATDDAIYKGINSHAQLIIVAPCCHKQIRKEMKKGAIKEEIKEITRHGIFMERQAEMVTDTLRALYLERAGYQTKLFDFIATEHTPKNIMIIGQKRKENSADPEQITAKIDVLKKQFGIEAHYLDRLFALSES